MNDQMQMSWWRFFGMIFISAAIMFFLMYQLVYEPGHLFFSLNRLIASLVMACVMTSVMLGFMWRMYKGESAKVFVLAGGIVLGTGFLMVNREQALIGDSEFMRAMIPHHSIAINNARKARISDPRVRQLADEIIQSQVEEIEEMKLLLDDIGENGERATEPLPPRSASVTQEMLLRIQRDVY